MSRVQLGVELKPLTSRLFPEGTPCPSPPTAAHEWLWKLLICPPCWTAPTLAGAVCRGAGARKAPRFLCTCGESFYSTGTTGRTALRWVSELGDIYPGLVSVVRAVLDWLGVRERSEHCCGSCALLAATFL